MKRYSALVAPLSGETTGAKFLILLSDTMTATPQARLVLQDVLYVRQKLEDELGQIEWRLYWVLAVVLLRADGHVLDKVDGANDPIVKKHAHSLFQSWRTGEKNSIFRDFIDKERNSILKEYQSSMTNGPVPVIAYLQSNDGFDTIRQFLIEENLYRPVSEGIFCGEDGRTLIDQAIDWWFSQLDEIDRRVHGTNDSEARPK